MAAESVWKSPAFAAAFSGGKRMSFPGAREQFEVLRSLLSALPREPDRFMDLGCGDGLLAAAVLDTFPRARGLLVDFSEAMLDIARGRLAGKGELEFALADFGDPRWVARTRAGAYGLVVSGYAIHHQDNRRKREVYAELLRALAPGGLFVHIEHVASAGPFSEMAHDEAFIDALAGLPENESVGRDEVAVRYHARPDKAENKLELLETQCRWLRELGYEEVDIWHKRFEFAVFGGFKKPAPVVQ